MDAKHAIRCGCLTALAAIQVGCGRQGEATAPPTLDKLVESIGMCMRRVAPGTFSMGSPESEAGRYGDETQHTVTLTKEYWLGRYEVTQAEWEAVMGGTPSNFKGKALPVENVSWNDAMEFCKKVTETEKQAGRLPDGYAYALPTEAQWEYACRAGSTGAYAGDLDVMAWYSGNSENSSHAVGGRQANAWGFHDMHGNVGEWCRDWYEEYPGGAATDPEGAAQGSDRVLRGGSWFDGATVFRSADRYGDGPGRRGDYLGFRLCLAPVRQ